MVRRRDDELDGARIRDRSFISGERQLLKWTPYQDGINADRYGSDYRESEKPGYEFYKVEHQVGPRWRLGGAHPPTETTEHRLTRPFRDGGLSSPITDLF